MGADSEAPEAAGGRVRRVRKAYEQVVDQLRGMIHSGALPAGARLPTELALAQQFGVSRTTVREAIRVLSTENLVHIAKGGSTPGTYVARPSVDHIAEFLSANIALLSQSDRISLEDFLEAREYLEVPAARLAAERRKPHDIHRLQHAVPGGLEGLAVDEQFRHNRDFHSTLMLASGNTLLQIAAQPVFSLLQSSLTRASRPREVHDRIIDEHRAIFLAIKAGDPEAAEREMRSHLEFLRPQYESAWQGVRKLAGD